jgi:hypothetical protein
MEPTSMMALGAIAKNYMAKQKREDDEREKMAQARHASFMSLVGSVGSGNFQQTYAKYLGGDPTTQEGATSSFAQAGEGIGKLLAAPAPTSDAPLANLGPVREGDPWEPAGMSTIGTSGYGFTP